MRGTASGTAGAGSKGTARRDGWERPAIRTAEAARLLRATGTSVRRGPGLTPPIPCHQVHDYLRSKLCSLYENDCIFDKFECVWNGSDR